MYTTNKNNPPLSRLRAFQAAFLLLSFPFSHVHKKLCYFSNFRRQKDAGSASGDGRPLRVGRECACCLVPCLVPSCCVVRSVPWHAEHFAAKSSKQCADLLTAGDAEGTERGTGRRESEEKGGRERAARRCNNSRLRAPDPQGPPAPSSLLGLGPGRRGLVASAWLAGWLAAAAAAGRCF
jgi:hypothetical protein